MRQHYEDSQLAFIKAVDNNVDKAAELFPQFCSIKSSLHSSRNQKYPPIPDTIDKVVIEGEWSLTELGNRYLLSHSKNATVFCTDVGLRILSLSRRWHSDGTFSLSRNRISWLFFSLRPGYLSKD